MEKCEVRRWWMQDGSDWYIGRWTKLWVSQKPLPIQLETKEFGECVEVVEAHHLTEAERTIAELKREALGALSHREIQFEQDNAKLRAQVEFAITEMKRLHHSNITSLLAATAWMGIPERKRDAFIEEHVSNSKFILDRALEQLKGGPDGKV